MREKRIIKFRVYDKTVGVMHYDIDAIKFSDRGINQIDTLTDNILYPQKEAELMQFTGLLDKNGKEIYEGDIVKFKRNIGLGTSKPITTGRVSYNPDYAQFEFAGYIIEPTIRETIEVIGNIYENPELIKKERDR